MVLDTSAVIASIANEADSYRYQDRMRSAESLAISAITALETRIVLYARFGTAAVNAFDTMIHQRPVAIIPFDGAQAEAAFKAFQLFGKGQGHPAQLNIIDCAAYALAKTTGDKLLFKGNDFAKTDVEPAI